MVKKVLYGIGILLVLIQFFQIDRTNPPITAEPKWDSADTRELARKACFDCHSNESKYPFYAYIAPFSWLVKNHIEEGRENLNFSEWKNDVDIDEIADEVNNDEMPLWDYKLMHSESRLTESEKNRLILGLTKTFELSEAK